METKSLNGLKVAILVTQGFEQVEMTEPRKALEEAGATAVLIAPRAGTVTAWDRTDWGDEFDVELELSEADADAFDALLLPGGVLSPDKLRIDEHAVAFTRHFFELDKPVAAICHGPWTLINAGVAEGRTMTSYPSVRRDLENAGARWVDQEAVVDGKLVTSRNPDDLPAFNRSMIEVFAGVLRTETAPS